MKLAIFLTSAITLTACASVIDAPAELDRYSHAEISSVVSTHFETSLGSATKALRPSFDKFGSPERYVSGNMSGVHDAAVQRLYGLGEVHARLALDKPIYWQIDGEALVDDVAPIATVHLIYDQDQFEDVMFESVEMQTRRSHDFTVFERKLDSQIIVSVYQTERLPKQAEFKTLIFETH